MQSVAEVANGRFVDALVMRARDIIDQARTGAQGMNGVGSEEGPWDVDVVVRAAGDDRRNLYNAAGDGFVLLGDCWRDRPKTASTSDAEEKTETNAALLYRSGAQVVIGATWPPYSTAVRVTWNLPRPYWHPASGGADTKEGRGGPTINDRDLDEADSKSGREGDTGNNDRTGDADVGGTDDEGSEDEETNLADVEGTAGPDEGDHDDARDGDGEGDVDCEEGDDGDVGGSNNGGVGVFLVSKEDGDEEFVESAY